MHSARGCPHGAGRRGAFGVRQRSDAMDFVACARRASSSLLRGGLEDGAVVDGVVALAVVEVDVALAVVEVDVALAVVALAVVEVGGVVALAVVEVDAVADEEGVVFVLVLRVLFGEGGLIIATNGTSTALLRVRCWSSSLSSAAYLLWTVTPVSGAASRARGPRWTTENSAPGAPKRLPNALSPPGTWLACDSWKGLWDKLTFPCSGNQFLHWVWLGPG